MTHNIILLSGAGILVVILLLVIYALAREVSNYYEDKDDD